jgi:dipeptidyl aminopeptidase/acylaminoacyl peptidase
LKSFVEYHYTNSTPQLGFYKTIFGDPNNPEDLEMMAAQSPITFASSLKFPVLAVYCQLDEMVPPKQTKLFIKTVDKALVNNNPKRLHVSDYFYVGEQL